MQFSRYCMTIARFRVCCWGEVWDKRLGGETFVLPLLMPARFSGWIAAANRSFSVWLMIGSYKLGGYWFLSSITLARCVCYGNVSTCYKPGKCGVQTLKLLTFCIFLERESGSSKSTPCLLASNTTSKWWTCRRDIIEPVAFTGSIFKLSQNLWFCF